jgi:hypothetical protein
MEITNRAAFQALKEAGLGSDAEITVWMNARQQATLRDQFAMSALQGLLADPIAVGEEESATAIHAAEAYHYADAMLAERVKS